MGELIEEHYLSALKRNPNYSKKYSRLEMRAWWYLKLINNSETDIRNFIIGSIHANNNDYFYHPV